MHSLAPIFRRFPNYRTPEPLLRDTGPFKKLTSKLTEKIFCNLTFTEVSKVRLVCRTFNTIGGTILTKQFRSMCRWVPHLLREYGAVPSAQPAFRLMLLKRIHAEVLLLRATFGRHVSIGVCCFYPGRLLDVFMLLMWLAGRIPDVSGMGLEVSILISRTMRNVTLLSERAIEHFEWLVVPSLKSCPTFAAAKVLDLLSCSPSLRDERDILAFRQCVTNKLFSPELARDPEAFREWMRDMRKIIRSSWIPGGEVDFQNSTSLFTCIHQIRDHEQGLHSTDSIICLSDREVCCDTSNVGPSCTHDQSESAENTNTTDNGPESTEQCRVHTDLDNKPKDIQCNNHKVYTEYISSRVDESTSTNDIEPITYGQHIKSNYLNTIRCMLSSISPLCNPKINMSAGVLKRSNTSPDIIRVGMKNDSLHKRYPAPMATYSSLNVSRQLTSSSASSNDIDHLRIPSPIEKRDMFLMKGLKCVNDVSPTQSVSQAATSQNGSYKSKCISKIQFDSVSKDSLKNVSNNTDHTDLSVPVKKENTCPKATPRNCGNMTINFISSQTSPEMCALSQSRLFCSPALETGVNKDLKLTPDCCHHLNENGQRRVVKQDTAKCVHQKITSDTRLSSGNDSPGPSITKTKKIYKNRKLRWCLHFIHKMNRKVIQLVRDALSYLRRKIRLRKVKSKSVRSRSALPIPSRPMKVLPFHKPCFLDHSASLYIIPAGKEALSTYACSPRKVVSVAQVQKAIRKAHKMRRMSATPGPSVNITNQADKSLAESRKRIHQHSEVTKLSSHEEDILQSQISTETKRAKPRQKK